MSFANQVYWAVIASVPLTLLACFSYFLIAEIGKSLKPVVLSRIATIALVFCAAAPLIVAAWITALQMNASADAMPVFEAGSIDSQGIESPSDTNGWELTLIQAIPQLGLVIVSVIVLLQVRHVVGFVLQAATVSRQDQLEDPDLRLTFDRLGRRLGAGRTRWRVAQSIGTPFVTGWFRPTISIPTNVSNQLERGEVENLVRHELAHVRRWDNWWLLVQRAIETLLWFHPHIWWLSQQLSKQRERCCDDIAVSQTDEPIEFANALRKLAHSISSCSPLRLAATYDREARIKRLIHGENEPIALHRCVFGGAGLMAAIWCTALASGASQDFVSVSISAGINPAGGREVVVDIGELRDVLHRDDKQNRQLALRQGGRIAINNCLSSDIVHRITLTGLDQRTTIVQVRELHGLDPGLVASWPTASIDQSDSDGESGRGGDCLLVIPGDPSLREIRCAIHGQTHSQGRYCAMAWQPEVPEDLDADFIGRASSLLKIQQNSATVPADSEMLHPCIDYATDIDVFQTVTSKPGVLTVTVDGGTDFIMPYVRLFDSTGRLRGAGVKSKFNHVCRFQVLCDGKDESTRHYIAVSNEDGKSTGRYTVSLALRPTDQ